MKIKKRFDKLKFYLKKDYCSRNGEEELIFYSKDLKIEFFYDGNYLSIIIDNGKRNNYMESNFFTFAEKEKIKSILESYFSLEFKCHNIEEIIIDKMKR